MIHPRTRAWLGASCAFSLAVIPQMQAADVGLTDLGGNNYSISSSPGDTLVIDSTSTFNESVTLGDTFFNVVNPAPYSVGDVLSGTYTTYTIPTLTRIDSITDVGGSFDIAYNQPLIGTGGEAVSLNLAKTVTLNAGGFTDLDGISMTDPGNRVLDLSAGTLRLGADGFITRTTDFSNSERGGLLLTGGTLTAGGADNTPGVININAPGNSSYNTQGLASIIIESQITDNGTGAVSVNYSDLGDQTVRINNAANSYSGGTTISFGRLWAGDPGSLGTGDVTVVSGGQVAYSDGGTHTNNLILEGSGPQISQANGASYQNVNAGALVLTNGSTVSGDILLTGDTRISSVRVASGDNREGTISGAITGAHALEFGAAISSNTFGSNIHLSNSGNDWTGDTRLANRATSGSSPMTLNLEASEVIPNGAGRGDFYIESSGNDNSRTYVNLNGNTETFNGLNSIDNGLVSNTRVIRNNNASDGTLIVGDNDADGNFDGTFSDGSGGGVLNLTKIGTGTQTLSGNLNHTGATTINGGILAIDSALANSAVTVNNGGTLSGVGNFSGGVTIASGGTLSPGNSPGIQTYTDSNLALETGATFSWELVGNTTAVRGTDFDGVDVIGSGVLSIESGVTSEIFFNIAGSTVDFNDAFWTSNQSWLVFDLENAATLDEPGIFGSVTASQDSLGNEFSITGGSLAWETIGNDVYLAYNVPEPSTYALLLGIGVLGYGFIRRRRK